jgi:hypothetical protein
VIVLADGLESGESGLVVAGLNQRVGGAVAVAEFLLGLLLLLFLLPALGLIAGRLCRRVVGFGVGLSGSHDGAGADGQSKQGRSGQYAKAMTVKHWASLLGRHNRSGIIRGNSAPARGIPASAFNSP